MILPEHMTVWDRNQRLYETLKGMGLHTEVVLCRDDSIGRGLKKSNRISRRKE